MGKRRGGARVRWSARVPTAFVLDVLKPKAEVIEVTSEGELLEYIEILRAEGREWGRDFVVWRGR